MQLFITPYAKENNTITITEERVVHQMKNVLRSKIGSELKIQNIEGNECIRYTLSIIEIDAKKIVTTIVDQKIFSIIDNKKFLCVALPNKFEKIELIVQKCTEIGIQHIIFFQSQYSQLHSISDNKKERLGKIALEAVEQSYGTIIPEIIFTNDIASHVSQGKIILLHQDGEDIKNLTKIISNFDFGILYFLIGPEGGRGSHDEKLFSQYDIKKISLGKNILRTETAAIVMAWEAINNA